MDTQAIVFDSPRTIAVRRVDLVEPGPEDIVVEVAASGISTGTERLFWSGEMPPFPGIGYPLVPGYEAVGTVVEAPRRGDVATGDSVFVPGAACYADVRGLFGGSARRLVTRADRVIRIDPGLGHDGVLIALAATARHAIAGFDNAMPELIVGHGTLGRLLARLTIAAGAPAPTVWEINPARRQGAEGYEVVDPKEDPRRDYACVFDASGDASALDGLVGRLAKGGEIVLGGFYPGRIDFGFAPAFMKELRLRIAAEWTRDDLVAVRALIDAGALSLDGLVTHCRPAAEAAWAYPVAFGAPACLKMVLDWKDVQ
jgi:3-hydroxyethyl bacteriochlorophyllide a dehydrogenase